jgi:hypothetical protein
MSQPRARYGGIQYFKYFLDTGLRRHDKRKQFLKASLYFGRLLYKFFNFHHQHLNAAG